VIQTIVLDSLVREFDRLKAAEAAGISVRALRLLISRDKVFKEQIMLVKKADDDELGDMARANIREHLEERDKTISLHVDRTRNGYGLTTSKFGKSNTKELPDPVDLETLDDAPPLIKAVALHDVEPVPGDIAEEESALEVEGL